MFKDNKKIPFNDNFTFQSGYVQIVLNGYSNLNDRPLHSNLVMFKFKFHYLCAIIGISLHSNLVMFKS